MIRVSPAVFAVFAIFFSVNGYSQNAASALPADPTALMTLAHQRNGLTGSDVKPWHMHGTYHSYKDGKPEYEGTYEEWWISPTQYKVTFSNTKETQTDFANGTALLRDGAQEWLNGPELLLRSSVVEPLLDPAQLKEFTLQRSEQAVGTNKIECVSFTYPVHGSVKVTGDVYPTACLESSMPVLRVFEINGSRIIYDQLAAFQGHYIARQIRIVSNGKLEADLNLDVVEALKPDLVLSAPATALPVDLTKIKLKEGRSQWPVPLKTASAVYPILAKNNQVSGIVTIRAAVGADGHVENMQPISGSEMLWNASTDAVQQRVYRPFVVMGQARPVEIEIHVNFSTN
jgi:Gram-negative bacterial TonB protein C-terminal